MQRRRWALSAAAKRVGLDVRSLHRLGALGVLSLGAAAEPASAEAVAVAVAANFLSPLREIEAEFEAATGHEVTVIAGSTGQLYAQIVSGAPFDVLLAADRERPRLLADAGLGDAGSVFTYAVGRLALWSREAGRVDESTLESLGELEFRWLAIASPDLAPYGAAARQVLEGLGVWQALTPRIVRGQNIAQAFAMTATGNAEIGFVALSQALLHEGEASYAVVPQGLHEPIRQDAVLLLRARDNAAALDFIGFLKRPAAVAIIERFGYAPDGGPRQSEATEAQSPSPIQTR